MSAAELSEWERPAVLHNSPGIPVTGFGIVELVDQDHDVAPRG